MFEVGSSGEAEELVEGKLSDDEIEECRHSFDFWANKNEYWVDCENCNSVPALNTLKFTSDFNFEKLKFKVPKSQVINGGPLAAQAVNFLSDWEPLLPGLISIDIANSSDGYEASSFRINSMVRSLLLMSAGGMLLLPNSDGYSVHDDEIDRFMEQLHEKILKFGPAEPDVYEHLNWSERSGFSDTFKENDGFSKFWELIAVLLEFEAESGALIPVQKILLKTWTELFQEAGKILDIGNSGERAKWANNFCTYVESYFENGGNNLADGQGEVLSLEQAVGDIQALIQDKVERKLWGVARFIAYSHCHQSLCVEEKSTENRIELYLRENLLTPALSEPSSFNYIPDNLNPFKVLSDPKLDAYFDYERIHKFLHGRTYLAAPLFDPTDEDKWHLNDAWILALANFQISDGYQTDQEANLLLVQAQGYEPNWQAYYYLTPDVQLDESFDLDEYLDSNVPSPLFKRKIKDFVSFVETVNPSERIANHIVFTGNPGTGKTTVARTLGKIFAARGLLSSGQMVETSRSDLVAEYVGQTAVKTRSKVSSAVGGVLFIDEAYALKPANASGSDYGQEAIDELLKLMEDNRENLIVIAAGYTSEMERFLNSNPGLKSRFPNVWHFPDFSEGELLEAFSSRVTTLGWTVGSGVELIFRKLAQSQMGKPGFGNARWARNLAEASVRRGASRDSSSDKIVLELDLEDNKSTEGPLITIQDALAELDSLQGLKTVKQAVHDLVSLHQLNARRVSQNLEPLSVSKHLVFAGPPGTGKTTVARLIGKIYNSLGILPTVNVRETGRSELVAGYVGQTALKTQEVLSQAAGGTLFVDEAYTLSKKSAGGAGDFGQEAIETILKYMEDNRDNIAVVIAGYTDEMKEFISSNPGLESRFTNVLEFEPFNSEEYSASIVRLLENKNLRLTEGAISKLKEISTSAVQKENFASGRDARNQAERIVLNQARRLALDPESSLVIIEESDIAT